MSVHFFVLVKNRLISDLNIAHVKFNGASYRFSNLIHGFLCTNWVDYLRKVLQYKFYFAGVFFLSYVFGFAGDFSFHIIW